MAFKPFDPADFGTPTSGFGSRPEDAKSGIAVRGFNALIDLLSRGTYASAAAADMLLDHETQTFGQALRVITSEAANPTKRLTYSQVLKNAFPEFSRNNPTSSWVLGLVGDIALDPLTYVGGSALKVVGKAGKSAIVQGSKWQRFLKEYSGLVSKEGMTVDELVDSTVKQFGITDTAAMREFATKTMQDSTKLRDTLLEESAQRMQNFTKMAELNEAALKDKLAVARYGSRYDELADAAKKGDIDFLHSDILSDRTKEYGRDFLETADPQHGILKRLERGEKADAKDLMREEQLASRSTAPRYPHSMRVSDDPVFASPNSDFRETRRVVNDGPVKKLLKKENPNAIEWSPAPAQPPIPGKDAARLANPLVTVSPRMLQDAEKKVINEFKARQAEIGDLFQREVGNVDKKLVDMGAVDRQLKGLVTDRYAQHATEVALKLRAKPTLQAAVGELTDSPQERAISALLDNPALQKEFAVKAPALLSYHVPFTSIYGTIGGKATEKFVAKVKELTPLKNLDKRISDLLGLEKENKSLLARAYVAARDKGLAVATAGKTGVTHFRELFDRFYEVPEEMREAIRHLQTQSDNIAREITPAMAEMFVEAAPGKGIQTLSKEARSRVGEFMWKFDDLTGRAKREGWYGTSMFETEAANLRARYKLEPDEMATVVRLQGSYHKMAELETSVGLLEHELANYSPRYYDDVKDAKKLAELRKNATSGVAFEFGPGEKRLLADFEAAKAAGLNPVVDAGAIYARRVLQHHQAFAQKAFVDRMVGIFGDAAKVGDNGLSVKLDEAELLKKGLSGEQARRLTRALTFVGEGLYSKSTNALVDAGLRRYDKLLGVIKRSATVFNPAFAPKQAIGNTIQSALVLPMRAATVSGFFDPNTYKDALAAVLNKEGGKGGFKTVLGEYVSGAQARKELFENGIVRHQTIEGLASGVTSAWTRGVDEGIKKWDKGVRQAQFDNRVLGVEEKKALTASKTWRALANYMNWPGLVEDISRSTLFINARRGGHSVGEAREMVEKALFDYSHGLSQFEQRVMKRLVPFYSYQRFAYELLYKTFTQKLGKGITAGKAFDGVMEAVGKAFGGEELTDSERASIPGWLLEQPSAVAGFNDQMKLTVKTFNSMTPLDILTFASIDEDERGEVRGVRRWIEKTFLAQLTPFIKLPYELMAKRNLFTGRQLEDKYTGISEQKVGEVDPQDALGALTAAVVGAGGAGNIALAMGAGTAMAGDVSPDLVRSGLKKLLGWEEREDPKTGKQVAYVNAYRMHVLSSLIPGLNHAMRPTKEQYTPTQRAMSTIFGIHTFEVDLQQTRGQKIKNLRAEYQKKAAYARTLALRGSEDKYHEALEDLQVFVAQLRSETDMLMADPVRGGGVP